MGEKRIIQNPSKYIQGPNLIHELGDLVAPFGKRFLLLTEDFIYEKKEEVIQLSFAKNELNFEKVSFNGECTRKEIDRISEIGKKADVEALIGFGGGKILDTGKYAAEMMGIPFISAPSISSTDAPCTSVVVIYTETGEVEISTNVAENPRMILVDSQMIADAPLRLFVSGMGDALSTYFEARTANEQKCNNILGGEITFSAMALAKASYDILIADGEQAKVDLSNKKLTPEVERVIEADTYLSGIGFESGGLSAAHAIHNAMKNLSETHRVTHGELVAFGTLCLVQLENRQNDEFAKIMAFCKAVALPTTLAQLGVVENVEGKIRQVAFDAMHQPEKYHMPLNATEETVYAAIMEVDRLAQSM